MVLATAAERRSPFPTPVVPTRWKPPDPTPLSPLPPDLGRAYAHTELCRKCGQVPSLRSVYPVEFRHHLTSCLLSCWACGHDFFKPRSALGLANSVATVLRSNANDAIRFYRPDADAAALSGK